jgi:hypothetical protein
MMGVEEEDRMQGGEATATTELKRERGKEK